MSSPTYKILGQQDLPSEDINDFAMSVLEGLSETPKRLSSRFLYDATGSEVFREIMELEEYYPTRCEAQILDTHGPQIARHAGSGPLNLVDLGAGDGAKTRILLEHLQRANVDVSYVPVDISESAMAQLVATMGAALPGLPIAGVVAEYAQALKWLTHENPARRNLVLFLGSNIGNFNKAQARSFLRRLWSALAPDDLVLVGYDLKKDIDLLLHAYNDAPGVTARFNLNLLTRINAELGGHFDISTFRHYSTYDVFTGAMESYLVSMEAQSVEVDYLHTRFDFNAWEPIHTEYSYKYLESDIRDLALATGFDLLRNLHDAKRWFCDSLWQVRKDTP